MKRALAERALAERALAEKAKQNNRANPNGAFSSSAPVRAAVPGTTTVSGPSVPQHPTVSDSTSRAPSSAAQKAKTPELKIEKPSPAIPSSGSKASKKGKPSRSPRSTSASSSPRPKKRARESLVKLEEEDEDDSNSAAFYLRHQNRALASELRSVKYQLARLEREREHRRKQCSEAVQNLNTLNISWGKIEAELEQQRNPKKTEARSATKIKIPASDAPLSTGSGKSVEWIGALSNSLARIGTTPGSSKPKKRGKNDGGTVKQEESENRVTNDDSMDVDCGNNDQGKEDAEDLKNVDDIANIAENMSERVSILQAWIWSLLQNLERSNPALNGGFKDPETSLPSAAELQRQVSRVEAENVTLQEHVEELARSRDEMVESDRRVRRGLYRLAAGRVNLKEVLKAVATADEDKESAVAWMESTIAVAGSNAPGSACPAPSSGSQTLDSAKPEEDGKQPVSSKEVEQLKKQISDLNTLASSRSEQIKKLLSEKEEQTKKINKLVLKEDKTASDIPSNDEVKRSDLYLELTAKLAAMTRNLEELNDKSDMAKKEWSIALADAEFSKKALEDLQANFSKRWAELTEEKTEKGEAAEGEGELSGISKAKDIITLQHKLTQALENVRQAESTRKTLTEAVAMNNSLQSKVEEFKAKYNALQAEKAARASNNQHTNSNSTPSKEGSSSSKTKSSSTPGEKSDRSIEKLQREYKRARKELAATTASKDAAKAKLERTEKDKEFLNQMNSRLLKQASEKDEINAKSLSTILHLKQLTEQITKEKVNLEQQVKSAGQLALAARLASNARERVAEEFAKRDKVLKKQLEELQSKCSVLAKEKENAEGKLALEKARMSGLISDAHKAKNRCEELAVESTKLQEEKQKIIESLAIAKREASEATTLSKKLATSKGGGVVSGFTAEQLNTQVSHLKSRLACPVCNVRDKKCILLRCRHMFCKQCVDENVKNRSRKCPACGGRFDTKDIADIWL